MFNIPDSKFYLWNTFLFQYNQPATIRATSTSQSETNTPIVTKAVINTPTITATITPHPTTVDIPPFYLV